MSGQAINDVASNHDMLAANRNSQRQGRSFGNVDLRVQIKSTETYVLGTGHARQVRTVEINVNDQPRAIELPALVGRKLSTLIFVKHSENGPFWKKNGPSVLKRSKAGIRV